MLRIVLAPDSFKGCLSSPQVAEACAAGIRSVAPMASVVQLPVADGGEGTASALARALGASWVSCMVCDPLMRPVEASYAVSPDGLTAILDVASAISLAHLAPSERNPLIASSFGVGQIISHAFSRGCTRFIVGLGGSATCDAGMGMLQALGVCFYDSSGSLIAPGSGRLADVRSFDASALSTLLASASFSVACDVVNPLCGPSGAACVFAPQKGASPSQVSLLDHAMSSFASLAAPLSFAALPGAGAAGGLGWAFAAFLSSSLSSGIDTVLSALSFSSVVRGASLVITGEGSLDRQTLFGKAPAGVLRACLPLGVPVVAMAGRVADAPLLRSAGFRRVVCINPPGVDLSRALDPSFAASRIEASAAAIVEDFLRDPC